MCPLLLGGGTPRTWCVTAPEEANGALWLELPAWSTEQGAGPGLQNIKSRVRVSEALRSHPRRLELAARSPAGRRSQRRGGGIKHSQGAPIPGNAKEALYPPLPMTGGRTSHVRQVSTGGGDQLQLPVNFGVSAVFRN